MTAYTGRTETAACHCGTVHRKREMKTLDERAKLFWLADGHKCGRCGLACDAGARKPSDESCYGTCREAQR